MTEQENADRLERYVLAAASGTDLTDYYKVEHMTHDVLERAKALMAAVDAELEKGKSNDE